MLDKPVEKSWLIEGSLDVLWKASIKALVEKGVDIQVIDETNDLIIVEELFEGYAFGEVTADRGAGFFGGRARVNILFEEAEPSKTRLTINPVLEGYGRSPMPMKATSNGKLERDYYQIIYNSIPREKTYDWLEDEPPPEAPEAGQLEETGPPEQIAPSP
jgi:hypothetical protein